MVDTRHAPGSHSDTGLNAHSLQAEMHVLGSLMEPLACAKADASAILEHLTARHRMMYDDQHHAIFGAIQELHKAGTAVTIEAVDEAMTRAGTIADVGGISYIVELNGYAVTTQEAVRYAKIVRDKANYREYTRKGLLIDAMLKRGECTEAAALQMVSKSIEPLIAVKELRSNSESIGSIMLRAEVTDVEAGISTGIDAIDQITLGLQKGNLIVLAARPRMGKTTLALTIARNVAIRGRHPVLMFSLEMKKRVLLTKVLGGETRTPTRSIKLGKLTDWEKKKIADIRPVLIDAPLYINDSRPITSAEIRAEAVRFKAEHGLALLVVDHIGIVTPDNRTHNLNQDVSQIVAGLKDIAMDLDIPVIALSQLNRMVDHRKSGDNKPRLSDLRDSGAVEQDADIVMFIYRDWEYIPSSEKTDGDLRAFEAEVNVAKNREEEPGTAQLEFWGKYSVFEDKPKQ